MGNGFGGRPLSDEWETPPTVFESICEQHGTSPSVDVCASEGMQKCSKYFTPKIDGLSQEWVLSSWVNPPHSDTKSWLQKADSEHEKHGIEITMLIPANATCALYAEQYLEKEDVTVHRYYGRIRFWQNGKPSKDQSRNAYNVIVWKKGGVTK